MPTRQYIPLTFLALLLGWSGLHAQAPQQTESEEAAAADGAGEGPSAAPQGVTLPEGGEIIAESGEGAEQGEEADDGEDDGPSERFIPSAQISEDLSVSFPRDI